MNPLKWIMKFFRGYETIYFVNAYDVDPNEGTPCYSEGKVCHSKSEANRVKGQFLNKPFTYTDSDGVDVIGKFLFVKIQKRKVPYDI